MNARFAKETLRAVRWRIGSSTTTGTRPPCTDRANISHLLVKSDRARRSPRLPYPSRRASFRKGRFNSTGSSPNPTPNLGSPEPQLSLSERLKKLSREYGWSALGVYLLLSALDFPLCFLAVRALGTDRIGRWEHAVVEAVKSILPFELPAWPKRTDQSAADVVEDGQSAMEKSRDAVALTSSEAADSGSDEDASVWTQLALAYAVHKSLIFIRVPLTAAVLPKVVRTLRQYGWNIGKRQRKSSSS